MKHFHILLNPASAGMRRSNYRHELLRNLELYLPGAYTTHESRFEGHLEIMTRELCLQGAQDFIAVGGDGTIQEVVNGLVGVDTLIHQKVRIGIISNGTGQGFARNLNLPRTIHEQLQIIRDGRSLRVDLGRIRFDSGRTRVFVNEFQVGLGAEVVRRVKGSIKRLGGTCAYGIHAVGQLLGHHRYHVTLHFDDRVYTGHVLGLVVANGAFTGGTMNLVPTAVLNDAELDLLIMGAESLPSRLRDFAKVYSGTHTRSQHFSLHRVRSIRIESYDTVATAADGEMLETLPCTIDILPNNLSVYTSQGTTNENASQHIREHASAY